MKVTIMFRGRNLGDDRIVNVTIPDICPACGGPRGNPVQKSFYEDGEIYTVDTWSNPCGHVDKYKDVIREAGRVDENCNLIAEK